MSLAGHLRSGGAVSRLATDYGMLGVLAILCIFFSWVTVQEQDRTGVDAARRLARDVSARAAKPSRVLIVARAGEEDARFADALESLLAKDGFAVAGKVQGDPRDARKALQEIGGAGGRIDIIATTRECADWQVIATAGRTFPAMAGVKVCLPATYTWPTFLKIKNLLNIANQIAVIAVVAIGMTMVIITGGIDLSVGSLVALSAVVAAWIIRRAGGEGASAAAMVLACLCAILASGLVGAFSGLVITVFRIPAFIATLGMMQVASGLAFLLAAGESIYQIPDSFTWLGRGADLWVFPNAVVLMVALYVAAWVLMSRTVLGRYIYAVGGNMEAARLSGIRVRAVLLFVYVTSGLAAGLGGVITASQLKSGAPTYGLMYELYVIAAVVVGGTSLAGGEGRILGTLIGAFIIAVIWNGMNLTHVESYTQKVVLGLVILAAVLVDTLKTRSWPWRSLRRPET
jgi:ribose transport system permease protein